MPPPSNPRPRSGYAYTSSRRHPREPEIIVLSDPLDDLRYVGTESIEHFAWVDAGPPRRFVFQTAISSMRAEEPIGRMGLDDTGNERRSVVDPA